MDARDLLDLVWIVPALPALGAVILLLFGRRIGEPAAGWVGTAFCGSAFVGAVITFFALQSLPGDERTNVSNVWTWMQAGSFKVELGFLVDPLSVFMILFVTGVASFIHLYSLGYMHGDERFSRFFAYLNLFVASMLTLVLGSNFLVTFLGWEGVGLCSYLLVSFWFERESAAVAGQKAFITNRVGDFGFMVAMFLIFQKLGTLDYTALGGAERLATGTATAIALLLALGAVGKSAQIPLYIWLPDAMEGPTPVSALIHAATMVTAGVFLIARAHPFFEAGPAAATTVAWIGGITAFYAATIAIMQRDIKKVLAYSTISQLGYMFLAAGIGAYSAALFHMITHAFFKATLFLAAGSVIHSMHDEQDMRRMGGLRKYLPVTFVAYVVGWLAISGVIPFSGFWSKDEILADAWFDGQYALWALGATAAGLTALYMTRQIWLVFYGRERFRDVPVVSGAAVDDEADETSEPADGTDAQAPAVPDPHESPWTMRVAMIVLGTMATIGGLLNLPFTTPVNLEFLDHWLEPDFQDVPPIDIPHFLGAATLSVVALTFAAIGIAVGYRYYRNGLEADGTDPGEKRLGRLAHVLYHGWYVDETWSRLVSGPGKRIFAFFSDTVDQKVIDGAVNGVAVGVRDSAGVVRRLQTGKVRNYALGIVIGAALLLIYIATRVVW